MYNPAVPGRERGYPSSPLHPLRAESGAEGTTDGFEGYLNELSELLAQRGQDAELVPDRVAEPCAELVVEALLMGQFAEGSKGKKKVTVTDVRANCACVGRLTY